MQSESKMMATHCSINICDSSKYNSVFRCIYLKQCLLCVSQTKKSITVTVTVEECIATVPVISRVMLFVII